jgi:hypothetical protein
VQPSSRPSENIAVDTLLDANAQMVPMVAQDFRRQSVAVYRVIKHTVSDAGQNMLVTCPQDSNLGLHDLIPSTHRLTIKYPAD